MKMNKDTTLSPHQAPDLFSRHTSKSFIKKLGRLTTDKLIYYAAAASKVWWEEAFKHSSQTQEWEWDRGRRGRDRGVAPAESFQNTYSCHTDSRHQGPRDLKLICCLAACLDRISEDSHVLPDCLWSTADGSQDWALDEKRLVSWSVRPSFELWGSGGVERCLAYDSQMCLLLKRLFGINLTPKNKPFLPFSYCDSFKKMASLH